MEPLALMCAEVLTIPRELGRVACLRMVTKGTARNNLNSFLNIHLLPFNAFTACMFFYLKALSY